MRDTRHNAGSHVVLVLGSAMAILPFIATLLMSLYPPEQRINAFGLPQRVDFSNYVRAWQNIELGRLMSNSVLVAVGVVLLVTAVSLLAGYAFAVMPFFGKRVLFGVFSLGLLMPFFSLIVPLYFTLRGVGLTNNLLGLILCEAALNISFGTYWMRSYYASFSEEILEAARIDGANSFTILWRILVPLSGPPLTTLIVIVFLNAWNSFFLVLVLIASPQYQTAPLGLSLFVGQYSADIPGLAAAAIMVAAPVVVVYVFLQRRIIQGVAAGAMKG